MRFLSPLPFVTAAALLVAACGESSTGPQRVDEADATQSVARSHLLPCTDVTLTTQDAVDIFHCSVVTGNLIIRNISDLTNVAGLSALTSVGGDLDIEINLALASIVGLSALTSVGGRLFINASNALTNVNGLSALTSVGGELNINSNAALTNVDDLLALTSVGGDLIIIGNAALANVNGLSAVTSVGGRLQFVLNAALTNIDGLSLLTSVGGDLIIVRNAALTSLNGLSLLTSVVGSLIITHNAALTNVAGLSLLTSVGGNLTIGANAALANVNGLSAVTSVGGNLGVGGTGLTNIDGLSALTSVGGGLIIANTAGLTDIDGLSLLTSFGGQVIIFNNAALTNIDGLRSLTSVGGDLDIHGNMVLANCTVGLSALLAADGVTGSITISNNATGCSSVAEIASATPSGMDVVVTPVDATTGETRPVTLTFDNVTGSGATTVTSSDPNDEPPLPTQFQLGAPATIFDIETTATFTGSVEVCFDYSGVTYGNENVLKLLHYDGAAWVDVTTSLDTDADIICGSVTALSPFAVAQDMVEELLQAILEEVLDLEGLNGNVTGSLVRKLDNALASWDRRNENAAINQLQAFVNEIEALVLSGRLDAGNDIIGLAQVVIDVLGG